MAKERQYGEQSRKSKTALRKVVNKRRMILESLEDRRLMVADALYYPPIGRFTAFLPPTITAQQYAQRSVAQYGDGGVPISDGGGEGNAPFSTTELEPNNVPTQAQLLPLGTLPSQSSVVTVSGQAFSNVRTNTYDEDYFAVDLRAGDIVDAALSSSRTGWDVSLFDSAGNEVMGSVANPSVLGYPPSSPLINTTAAVTFALTVGSTGRYYFRVADGNSAYSLRLRAFRNSIESEPIGTKQILYLDFNGSTVNPAIFGGPSLTSRIPSLIQTLEPYGFTQVQENELIDKIVAKVKEDFIGSLPSSGGNGYFGADGRPGSFDIDIRNSRDNADPWGLPNVSRVLVGGSVAEFPIATIGIAQSIDIGNYDRRETAVVMPGELFFPTANAAFRILNDPLFIPRSPSSSLVDMLSTSLASIISHEAGHFFGAWHQDTFNTNLTTMDAGNTPLSQRVYGVGLDGIYGTADDFDLDFGSDRYNPVELFTGTVNHANTMAFNLATGKVGATVTGTNFNDRNRNGRQDTGDEGLAGWTIYADINGNNVLDAGDTSTTTAANGTYTLGVPVGTFNIRSVLKPGWVVTAPSAGFSRVTVTGTQSISVNFGHNQPSSAATGMKWLDLNADGIRDTSEPGLAGVYIYIDLDGDDRPDVGEPATLSGADGSYTLTPPSSGVYAIREVVQAGYVQTFPQAGEYLIDFGASPLLRGLDFGNNESSDWGDAPAPYPTTRAQNGASHGTTPGLRLGDNIDADKDGQPSSNADGDNVNGPLNSAGTVINDEDGVSLLTPIVRGDGSNIIRVNVTNATGSPAYLQGWIDFNGNGSWTDPGEQIATNVAFATSGSSNITFTTPSNAVGRTLARFRLSQDKNLLPTGRSSTGEVEDYVYSIVDGPRVLLQPDTFTVARNSQNNVLDVLANDFKLPNDPFTLSTVSSGSQGGRVTIDQATQTVRYTPKLSFTGRDTFTYTATTASGLRETTTVTVNVALQFIDPVAVDDSFDVPTNSIGFPLSVLANDVEGRGGALIVQSVTTPDKGGSVVIGSGSQSIRYTPRRDFGGTEQFSYTAVDGTGKVSTANITVHTLQGDRSDDEVEFSFRFLNSANEPITAVRQGDIFKVVVYVDDLRPEKAASEVPPRNVTDPGVYSAYLDLLYSSGLVTPNAPTSGTLDFAASFQAPYQTGRSGTAVIPGIIDELGAFVGQVTSFNQPNPLPLVVLDFTATSAGIAEFVGDPADKLPGSEVTFYNAPAAARVANEQIRFGRSTLEIVPNGVNFPFAVDDTRFNVAQGNPFNVDVLTNDVTGNQPPIRITSVTQPGSGQTQINDNGTPNNFADDTITYIPNTNFIGLDQFQYTITDVRGFISTATVTMHVGAGTADDVVKLRLSATDLAGVPIDQITVGQQFQLRGYVEDLRTSASQFGVFAAFQDILYSSNLVSVNTSTLATDPGFRVDYAPGYSNAKAGDIRIPGLINEIGSAQTGGTPTGLGEKLQFSITLTARNTGTATFIGDPADIKPFHDSFVFDPTTPLLPSQIRYLSDTLLIVSTSGGNGSSGGEGNTNLTNAFDVNNDGFVSPIDVLILVNSLNTGGSGLLAAGSSGGSGEGGSGKYFLDVNQDSYLSPLDALMVINELNQRQNGGSGEGEAATEAVPLASSFKTQLVEVPFATKRSTVAPAFVYGPLPTTEEVADTFSLDEYLAQQSSGEEEFDYLDGLAADVLKSNLS
ncbi:MAG: Ig-like domain-containing protein [Planctomycetota bacterium]|nr:Ig-like domain-containing protein [Planctomycetota bacterium]